MAGEPEHPGKYTDSPIRNYIFNRNSLVIQFFLKSGMNAFRIPFLAERMIEGGLDNPLQLAGNLDQNYLQGMKNVVFPQHL
jgi:hypothetical protein